MKPELTALHEGGGGSVGDVKKAGVQLAEDVELAEAEGANGGENWGGEIAQKKA